MKLIKKRTQAKIQLTSFVDQAFPELQYFFKSGIHQKSVYAVLKEAPSTEMIATILGTDTSLSWAIIICLTPQMNFDSTYLRPIIWFL